MRKSRTVDQWYVVDFRFNLKERIARGSTLAITLLLPRFSFCCPLPPSFNWLCAFMRVNNILSINLMLKRNPFEYRGSYFSEYLRMKKHPSILKACRVTTQKLLYFLVFAASLIRGAYFASPVSSIEPSDKRWPTSISNFQNILQTISSQLSISLLAAYYPLVLTGSSLIVCFWAEVFHLQQIRWDRPRFLSKSFLGFLVFNLISYSLFIAELVLVWVDHDDREFYTHIFNGCYAGLMFIVVIFFLIYGVEVFFKVSLNPC